MAAEQEKKITPPGLAALLRSWFAMTRDEQRIVLAITGLFLLGLLCKYWHLAQGE